MGIPWHGFVGTALWILVVSCCLALALPNISSWWSGATPCGVVPECVEKVTNAYPQTYHAFVAVGLGVVLLREGTLLLVSVADQLMTSALQKKKTSNLAHRLEFKDFLAQYLLCMLLSSLTSFETYLASTSMPLVHVVQNAVVPVYTVRYIEWLVDVPLLMTLTCCGALGRPLSQALGPIVATNCYIIVSWAALFLEDACVRNTVITATFVAYAWASERMIQWVRDFLRESQDVPCRNTRVASVILLIVVFGIYGIIYLAGVAGLISFEMEHLGYTFMGFSCKVTLSILFASIRAYQNHQVLARLVGKLRGVSVAFVSLLRGSFDHVVPCAVNPDGMCYLPERSSRDFQDLERFLGKTMESKNFNDLLDKDDRERFTNYVRNAVRQNDLSFQQMDAGTITSQPPVAHALHISLQRDAVLVHLSLVPHGGESDRRGNRLAAFLALQITSQEVEWPMDHSQMREVEDKVTDVPYSSGTPSTDDVSTEGRGQEGQRISLSGTRDTEDELSATISLGEAAKRSNVGKNISNKRRKRDAKLLVKILQRRLRRKSRKDSKDCETSVKADVPGRVSDRQSDRMSRMSDKTSIQKVSFICGGSDVRSQSSRLSAANSVMMACRQLLGPLHDELPPAQYISRRMEDHLQCSAEMVKLKACSEITRHSQKQKMDEWKRRHDAHQLSVMLEKSGAPGCGLPEQLWRSEVLGNLNESHPGPRPEKVDLPTEEELWHKAWRRTYEESESGSSGEGEDP